MAPTEPIVRLRPKPPTLDLPVSLIYALGDMPGANGDHWKGLIALLREVDRVADELDRQEGESDKRR